jgi:hypothetical protein
MLIGENAHITGFNTQRKQVHILEFKDARDKFSRKENLSASIASGVVLDGIIISIKPQDLIDSKGDFPTFSQTLSFFLEDEKYIFRDVNKFDLVKLFIVSKLTNWEEKNYKSVQSQSDGDLEIEEEFYDSGIFNEKTSIEIVNSTDINGLGGRFGLILSNLGMNVISVRDGGGEKTQILTNSIHTKTLKRIEDLLEMKAQKTESVGVSDITINLGKDFIGKVER